MDTDDRPVWMVADFAAESVQAPGDCKHQATRLVSLDSELAILCALPCKAGLSPRISSDDIHRWDHQLAAGDPVAGTARMEVSLAPEKTGEKGFQHCGQKNHSQNAVRADGCFNLRVLFADIAFASTLRACRQISPASVPHCQCSRLRTGSESSARFHLIMARTVMIPVISQFSSTTLFHAVQVLLAVGVAVSTLEFLHIRRELCDDGWLSWRVRRLSNPGMSRIVSRTGSEWIFRYPGVLFLLMARFAAAVTLVACIVSGHSSLPFLLVLTITCLLITLRSPQGNDGADQMSLIALTAATMAALAGTTFSIKAGLIFIAAQSGMAYATSGLLKVKEAGWRDGRFVTEILKTSTFGNRILLRTVEQSLPLAIFLGCSVAIGDCVLGFAAFMPPDVCLAVLVFGLFLHIGIAAVLGLNTFLWSFVGTYPAVFWVSTSLYSKI
jgi:hypothetical protein